MPEVVEAGTKVSTGVVIVPFCPWPKDVTTALLSHSFDRTAPEALRGGRSGRMRQLLHRNVQRFRGGLVFKAHRLCVSLNSRLESNKEEEDAAVWLSLVDKKRDPIPGTISRKHSNSLRNVEERL